MVTVTGFTTADIHAARDLAGPYGTLKFPNGVYDCDGIIANQPFQTWEFERAAKLLRSPTSIQSVLNVYESLSLVGGIIDGNRANNTAPGCGIASFVHDFELSLVRTVVQNTNYYGIAVDDCALFMDRCTVKDTSATGLIWRTHVPRVGPQLYRTVFDRSHENPATMLSGGAFMQGIPENSYSVMRPRIVDCDFMLPYTMGYDTGGLCIFDGSRGYVSGCNFSGGRIQLSLKTCESIDIGPNNKFAAAGDYAIEAVSCNDMGIRGNMMTGAGPSKYGIELNSCTGKTRVFDNVIRGFSVPIHGTPTDAWAD